MLSRPLHFREQYVQSLELPLEILEAEEDLQAVAIRGDEAEPLGDIDFLQAETGSDQRIAMRADQLERGATLVGVDPPARREILGVASADDGEKGVLREAAG